MGRRLTIHSVWEKLRQNKKEKGLYMRRLAAVMAVMTSAAVLCGCQEQQSVDGAPRNASNESSQEKISASVEEAFQKSFTVGGIEVSASEGLDQTLTDTELTDAVEELLAEKYGEEFSCEQYLYYEEFALNMNLTAYPIANPELCFEVVVQGSDRLEIWWDEYYNELYRKDINRYLYEAVAPDGIGQEEFFVKINGMVTTAGVSEETFYQQKMNIMISVPEERVEDIQDDIQEIIGNIYAAAQSETDFWVYLCEDGIHSWEDFRYDGIWESYRVEYVEGSEDEFYETEWELEEDLYETEQEPAAGFPVEWQSHLEVYLGSTPGLYCEIPIQSGETATAVQGDYPALIMVDAVLYQDTGKISTEPRCGMRDGEITSTVDTVPVEDDQSNFGTGYGYQYGRNGIEVSIDGEWHIFERYIDD